MGILYIPVEKTADREHTKMTHTLHLPRQECFSFFLGDNFYFPGQHLTRLLLQGHGRISQESIIEQARARRRFAMKYERLGNRAWDLQRRCVFQNFRKKNAAKKL